MKKKILIFIIVLLLLLLTACSKKTKSDDKYYYYNDLSRSNFKTIDNGEKIEGSSLYMSIGRYIYEIDSKVYPEDKNYSLEIPFYIPEDSNKILALRCNAPFSYKKSLDGFGYRLTIDYKTLEMDEESGSRELVFEYISDDSKTNLIDESIVISNMYSEGNKYENYLEIPIKEPIQMLADDIRGSLAEDEQDNLSALTYAYIRWIRENMYYPVDTEKYTSRYNNLNNSVMTLDLKLGNCDDFSVLLSELLISQGISARRPYGNYPKKLNEMYKKLDDYDKHMNVEVYDGKEWIMLEPTSFDIDNPIDFEIYENTIKVRRGRKIHSIKVIPFLVEGISLYQSSGSPSTAGVELIDIDFLHMYH